MQTGQINTAFQHAEVAFRNKRFDEALAILAKVEQSIAPHPNILHLKGLCLKGLPDLNAAIDTLAKAERLAPGEPQISNNLANCLLDAGRHGEALLHYSKALARQPNFAEARLNKAICLHMLKRFEEARVEFDALIRQSPSIGRLWRALGAMEVDAGEHEAARLAYERALELAPDDAKAKAGLAKTALELGDADAVLRYRTALDTNPGDRSLAIGLAYARQARGDSDAASSLQPLVEADPAWIEGQENLASIRWEAGDAGHYTDLFEAALAKAPDNDAMRMALCRIYSGSNDTERALATAMGRPTLMPDNLDIKVTQAILASEHGDATLAEELFADLPADRVDVRLHKAKHALRQRDAEKALIQLERVTAQDVGNISAWAFTDICWRLLGDDRQHWLHGQPGLYGTQQLELDEAELLHIADWLRAAHGSMAQPLGQSLRGGTQTRGRIFVRTASEIQSLKQAVERSVNTHWDGMPAYDATHPLLRHRKARPKFDGSWSVRLTSAGFHVQHIHPNGLLSSACYLALPDNTEDLEHKEGWLELGRAAPDLGWDMEPIAQFQPRLGLQALFPSSLFHGTRPFKKGERITVAFDIVSDEMSQ